MAYLTGAMHGQNLNYVKALAKDQKYTVVTRSAVRGVYDIYILRDLPLYDGQSEFIIREQDKVWGR